MTYVIESNHPLQYHPKLFDFPPAVTPAPPVPERNHPIHKHIRAQSEGHTIVNNVSPFNVTAARRTQSTFTKASPNGRVALLPTHSDSPSPPDSPRSGISGAEAPANANANANTNTNSTSTDTSIPTSPASGTRSSRSSRRSSKKSGSLSSTRQVDAPQAQAQAQAVTHSSLSLSSPVASSGKVRLQLGLPPKSSPRSSPRRANRHLPNTQSQQSPPSQHTSIHPPASSPPTEYHSLPQLTHTPDTITPSLESHSTSASISTSTSLPGAAAATAAVESDHVDSSPFPTQSSVVDESVTTPLFSDPPFALSDEIVTRPMSSSTLDTIPIAATFHGDHPQHSNQLDPNS